MVLVGELKKMDGLGNGGETIDLNEYLGAPY